MKNWSSQGVTNTLLLIIAFFQLLLVVNSNSHPKNPSFHGDLSEMGSAPSPSQPMMNPHGADSGDADSDQGGAQPPQMGGNMNFQNMIFAALRCPSDATITLADVACRGKDADTRRKFVDGIAAQNLPPRMMFDKIIEKFGEKALSDEALEIRKNNRR